MISVIIPVYNREQLIQETLNSLVMQDTDLDIIVVDDGSTDKTYQIIEDRFPTIRLYKTTHLGAASARNFGLEKVKSKYVLFLDSDDILSPSFFKKKIKVLNANNDIAAVYGPWAYFKSDYTNIIPRKENYPIRPLPDASGHLTNLLLGWYIHPASILWRTDKLLEVGGYDPDLSINQDVDLLFKVLLRYPIIGVDSPHALIREHEGARVGNINNPQKLEVILGLRKRFLAQLEKHKLKTKANNEALGRYLFNLWAQFKKTYPEEAKKCLLFSREIYPDLHLKGGALLRILSGVLGPVRATHLKSWMKEINH